MENLLIFHLYRATEGVRSLVELFKGKVVFPRRLEKKPGGREGRGAVKNKVIGFPPGSLTAVDVST